MNMGTDVNKWTDFGPIDVVRCFHNAFRRDLLEIDEDTLKTVRTRGDLTPILNRMKVTGEILNYHAKGEEEAVFPAVDKVAPLLAKTYVTDHRELDDMVAGLGVMSAATDPLVVARATAVLRSHLRIHLYKEDTYLYPTLRENTGLDEQVSIVGVMARSVPQEKTPLLVRWLFPLLKQDDQVILTKGWMNLMPPQVFSGLKPLIREAVDEDWTELTGRVLGLA
jgi:iron-sulfur cluster repair protein YtfE (RIC family)